MDETKNEVTDLPYGCDYAKSNRARCVQCKNNIDKGVLRMSTRIPSSHFDGIQDLWHHYDCFWLRYRKNITEASIRGFEALKWEDQNKIREKLNAESTSGGNDIPPPDFKPAGASVDKAKSSQSKCGADCGEKISKGSLRLKYKSKFYHTACLAKQNLYQGTVDEIKGYENLEKEEQQLLKSSFAKPEKDDGEASPPKKARLADPPEKLEALRLQSETLWSVLDQIRGKFYRKEQIIPILKENNTCGGKRLALEQCLELLADLITFGSLPLCELCNNSTLRWSSDLHSYKCCAFITEYTRCSHSVRFPTRNLFQLPNEYLNNESYEFLEKYNGKQILETGRLFSASVEANEVFAIQAREYKKGAENEEENRRCIVKNGCTVDPKCEVAERVHVYIEDKKPWQALLTMADLASGQNSFYKLQLCEDDRGSIYYVFRAWGRVGSRGGSKTECFDGDLSAAKHNFEFLFHEKSQNMWGYEFTKVPGGMELVEMEVDDEKLDNFKQLDEDNSTSSLPLQLKRVISLFFDVNLMAKQMAEFELDTEKLPLAKLAKTQLLRAHSILSELSDVLAQENPSKHEILDLSNKFYTVIPHASPAAGRLPLINSNEMLKGKADMIDSLLELEIAYKLIKQEEADEQNKDVKIDPFDRYYNTLNCDIALLDRESEDFKLIQVYITNGHMSTHHFKVEIKEIFSVNRHGEREAYMKKSKSIKNKRLLWHGSRTSNFVGIISNGLKIAPKEAPCNGYMFGKGVYFADCVSKSAQYCSTSGRSDVFLLLAEVALGEMQEEKHAVNVVKPKKGFHSVKGLGRTAPDDSGSVTMKNVMVPVGKARAVNKDDHLSLLYNEYIIYDERQCHLKYLIHAELIY